MEFYILDHKQFNIIIKNRNTCTRTALSPRNIALRSIGNKIMEDISSGPLHVFIDCDDEALAKALAGEINKRGGVSFTAAEKFSSMEGKWKAVIICDPANPEKTGRFAAIDPKTEKVIKDFKEKWPGLLPKMRDCRLKYDISKKRASDLNSGKKYMLIYKD